MNKDKADRLQELNEQMERLNKEFDEKPMDIDNEEDWKRLEKYNSEMRAAADEFKTIMDEVMREAENNYKEE